MGMAYESISNLGQTAFGNVSSLTIVHTTMYQANAR